MTKQKFYCDYCDVFLTHNSAAVRKAHNAGRNHLTNVKDYYASLGHDKAQSIIDEITRIHEMFPRPPPPPQGAIRPPPNVAPTPFAPPPPQANPNARPPPFAPPFATRPPPPVFARPPPSTMRPPPSFRPPQRPSN